MINLFPYNSHLQNGVQWVEKSVKINPISITDNIHVIKIPHLHTEQKLDKLMHTDDRSDLVSNKTKDLEQFQDRYLYGDNKNANMPSDKKAYKYRHKFGMSFHQAVHTESNEIHRGINWISCEEASGKLLRFVSILFQKSIVFNYKN